MPTNASMRRFINLAATSAFLCIPTYVRADSFTQINLVSDIPGLATFTDPNLKNPWGVASSATSPFWVSDQGSGKSTLYDGAGNINALVVTVPGAGVPAGPTGQVFNGGTGFLVNGTPARFIFDNLNGTIAGWNAGSTAVVTASTSGAVYTGLAIGTSNGSTYLYAANSKGSIQVFDSNWNNVSSSIFAGKFNDPNLPAGYVPFNVQTLGSTVFVTYASLTPQGGALPGGYVAEFDASGNFITQIAGNGAGGALYAPWGITIAPSSFGSFSNDLLVGNFGNGLIQAFDPGTGAFLGSLTGANGQPLVNSGLWALDTRTGGANVNTSAVYFTAGINGEQDGLFGAITATQTPEPATLFEAGTAMLGLLMAGVRRRSSSRL